MKVFTTAVLLLISMLGLGCKTEANKTQAPSAEFTAFVNRGTVVETNLKSVRMMIMEVNQNPWEQDLMGLSTTYYFNLDGILQAESGDSSIVTQYIYDQDEQITSVAWSNGIAGELENIKPADDKDKARQEWSYSGDPSESITLSILNACFKVTAEYEFHHEVDGGLPKKSEAIFVRNLNHEGGAENPPKKLYVFYDYEFYDY